VGRAAGDTRRTPPPLGSDSVAILREIGVDDGDIAELIRERIVGAAPESEAVAASPSST